MLPDVVESRRFAETENVCVLGTVLVRPPGMIGAGNLADFLIAQFTVHPVDQRAHLARIDEQRLAAPVSETTVLLAAATNHRQTGIGVE